MSLGAKSKYAGLSLIVAGVVIVLLLYVSGRGTKADAVAVASSPAVEVDVAQVVAKDITDWQSYSGRLEAIDHVEIHALVPGTIVAVYFRDGQLVKKGDPLFLIDPRPYAAAVDQGVAAVAEARARAAFKKTDYARAQKLLDDDAISKRDFEDKSNQTLAAEAEVKGAEAALELARVNLGYTRITAPVAGRMSRAEQTVGNTVNAGNDSPKLSKLVSVSPMYADFDVDEQTYLRGLSRGNNEGVPVKLGLADEIGYSRMGKIASVDNALDPGSGTIRVRAAFDNLDGSLMPGLYARIQVGPGRPHPAILVDEKAVLTDQARKFVLVVDGRQHAQYRQVVEGPHYEGWAEIASGLKAGESIVVSGMQRVHPGDAVAPKIVTMAGENARPIAMTIGHSSLVPS
jgi:multidrug efflux system membrane fusion protein